MYKKQSKNKYDESSMGWGICSSPTEPAQSLAPADAQKGTPVLSRPCRPSQDGAVWAQKPPVLREETRVVRTWRRMGGQGPSSEEEAPEFKPPVCQPSVGVPGK